MARTKVVLLVLIFLFLAVFVWTFRSQPREIKETKKKVKDKDYEGDEYTGSDNYIGDKDYYYQSKGRNPAYVAKSTLYKVIEPAHKLRYDTSGLIKTNEVLKRGVQVRIVEESLENPIEKNGNKFVQTLFGHFVRLDKIEKVS